MNKVNYSLSRVLGFFNVCFVLILLTACAVSLVSPYNEKLVTELNDTQTQINNILGQAKLNIGKPQGSYKIFQSQYVAIDSEFNTIVSQMDAIPNNAITLKQLLLLNQTLQEIKQLHRNGFKTAREIDILQTTVNDDFSAIYRLQYAKKQYLTT